MKKTLTKIKKFFNGTERRNATINRLNKAIPQPPAEDSQKVYEQYVWIEALFKRKEQMEQQFNKLHDKRAIKLSSKDDLELRKALLYVLNHEYKSLQEDLINALEIYIQLTLEQQLRESGLLE